MKRQFISLLVVTLMSLTMGLPVTQAQESITVKIGKPARLVKGGQAVDLRVKVTCPSSHEVLEAFAYVVQNGNESNFAFMPLICDGRPRQYAVRATVFPDSPRFRRGDATATVFILLLNPSTGETESGQASQPIQLR
jgi:hypothetical protein